MTGKRKAPNFFEKTLDRLMGLPFWNRVDELTGFVPTQEEADKAMADYERRCKEYSRLHADEIEWERLKRKYFDTDEPLTEDEKRRLKARYIRRLESTDLIAGSPDGQSHL